MTLCTNYDDGTQCINCGVCGKVLCREHANEPCDSCGYCEYGGITVDKCY